MISLRYYQKNVAEILSSINEDWRWLTKPKLRGFMITHTNLGNFVFYIQTISTTLIISLQIISSLSIFSSENVFRNNSDVISFEREFPIRTKCLFKNVSGTSYMLICIMQSIQLISTALGNVGIDIFFFNLSMQICGRLEILYEEMSELKGTTDEKETKFKMIALIERHRHLWKEAQAIEYIFNSMILMQLVINITGICAYGKYIYY